LSNIDSSDKEDQDLSSEMSQLQSDNEEMGAGLTQQVKPWSIPVAETPFKVKNQIFYSPKVQTSASKEAPTLESSCKIIDFKSTNVTFTPVPKMNMQQILPR
jgi:hypothetical protein